MKPDEIEDFYAGRVASKAKGEVVSWGKWLFGLLVAAMTIAGFSGWFKLEMIEDAYDARVKKIEADAEKRIKTIEDDAQERVKTMVRDEVLHQSRSTQEMVAGVASSTLNSMVQARADLRVLTADVEKHSAASAETAKVLAELQRRANEAAERIAPLDRLAESITTQLSEARVSAAKRNIEQIEVVVKENGGADQFLRRFAPKRLRTASIVRSPVDRDPGKPGEIRTDKLSSTVPLNNDLAIPRNATIAGACVIPLEDLDAFERDPVEPIVAQNEIRVVWREGGIRPRLQTQRLPRFTGRVMIIVFFEELP